MNSISLRNSVKKLDLYLCFQANSNIDSNNWRKTFKKMLKKAKLRRIRIHDARHTYATLRISKGDNIADVSKQLGHYSVRTTMDVYYHWLPGNKKSEVDALDDIIEEQKVAVKEG